MTVVRIAGMQLMNFSQVVHPVPVCLCAPLCVKSLNVSMENASRAANSKNLPLL